VAERVFEQIHGFSGFGFPKAHAVAFGLLAYQSTWLRVHYGPEFLCSLLNEQPMGFYPPDALVHEAQRRGIEVRPPDVNASDVECTVEGSTVRIGLGYITGLREDEARALAAERERDGPYVDLADLASRSGVGRDALERLAWAGACERIGGDDELRRRRDLWQLGVANGARRLGGNAAANPAASSRSTECYSTHKCTLDGSRSAHPALPPPPHPGAADAARARLVGAAAGRLLVNGAGDRRASDEPDPQGA
jgi:DNA polymerase III alpha subunit